MKIFDKKTAPLLSVFLYGLCSLILVGFHGRFYDNFKNYFIYDKFYTKSLQACIAFSSLSLVFALVGIFLVYFNKKFYFALYAIIIECLMIGLFVSTLVYVVFGMNENIRRVSCQGYNDDLALLWSQSYYGGMILSILIIIIGSGTNVFLIKQR